MAHGRLLLVALLLVAGCTKDNPRACGPGDPCTDPAFPFCDIDGIVGDLPGDCLAVDCTPGDFVACNADRALQCNATGDNYGEVLCERGCDPLSNGCRLCNPNETACTNGVTATCDANGAVVATTPCPLGCFESEPRCREVDPSNGLAMYLDMAATGPDIDVPGIVSINAESGVVFSFETQSNLGVPSTLLPAPPGGVRVRVFMFRSLAVADVVVTSNSNNQPGPAVAILSDTTISIHGTVDVSATWRQQFEDALVGPGSLIAGACVGGDGGYYTGAGTPSPEYVWGAGGGGNGTPGGNGGSVAGPGNYDGGLGGGSHGIEALEPLVGGCAGGPLDDLTGGPRSVPFTGAGGGAIQIVARDSIALDGGSILANGAGGYVKLVGGAAGGAGGSILLEAPTIRLAPGSALTANGGSGGGGDANAGADGSRSTAPAPPVPGGTTGPCAPPALCASSGAGGALGQPATDGGQVNYDASNDRFAGGGGGAAGRIRINTRDATYTKASDVIESPAPSVGTVRTR